MDGELKAYNDMINQVRALPTKRREEEVKAIIGVRYGSDSVMQGAAEVMAYGTAVKIISFASGFDYDLKQL